MQEPRAQLDAPLVSLPTELLQPLLAHCDGRVLRATCLQLRSHANARQLDLTFSFRSCAGADLSDLPLRFPQVTRLAFQSWSVSLYAQQEQRRLLRQLVRASWPHVRVVVWEPHIAVPQWMLPLLRERCPQWRALQLCRSQLGKGPDAEPRWLQALQGCTGLEGLHGLRCRLKVSNMAALVQLRHLRSLCMEFVPVSNLRHGQAVKALRALCAGGGAGGNSGDGGLGALVSLDLRGQYSDCGPSFSFDPLSRLASLTHLGIHDQSTQAAFSGGTPGLYVSAYIAAARLARLRSLELAGAPHSLDAACPLRWHPALMQLAVERGRLDNAGASHLAACSALHTLRVMEVSVAPAAGCLAPQLLSLKELFVCSSAWSAVDLVSFAPSLTALEVSSCGYMWMQWLYGGHTALRTMRWQGLPPGGLAQYDWLALASLAGTLTSLDLDTGDCYVCCGQAEEALCALSAMTDLRLAFGVSSTGLVERVGDCFVGRLLGALRRLERLVLDLAHAEHPGFGDAALACLVVDAPPCLARVRLEARRTSVTILGLRRLALEAPWRLQEVVISVGHKEQVPSAWQELQKEMQGQVCVGPSCITLSGKGR